MLIHTCLSYNIGLCTQDLAVVLVSTAVPVSTMQKKPVFWSWLQMSNINLVTWLIQKDTIYSVFRG